MSDLVLLVVRFLVTGLSVLLVSMVMPGMKVQRYMDAVWFSVVVAVLNVVAFKVFGFITVPLSVLTLGIVYFFLNGLIFLGAKKIVKGVEISGCFVASIAALLVSLVNSVLMSFLH